MSLNKTKIEWADSTWNPVTGCFHTCHYCYARRIAKRFEGAYDILGDEFFCDTEGDGTVHVLEKPVFDLAHNRNAPYPYGFDPTFHAYKLGDLKEKQGQRIFVCSMADLFGDWVPDEWIIRVFKACLDAPQHIYIFLTKNPERYRKLDSTGQLPHENNFWYGTTVVTPLNPFFHSYKVNTFLSIEPIMASFSPVDPEWVYDSACRPKWVIIGAMTGPQSKDNQPKPKWIIEMKKELLDLGIPTFMKDSLIPIVEEANMVREWPVAMMRELAIRRGEIIGLAGLSYRTQNLLKRNGIFDSEALRKIHEERGVRSLYGVGANLEKELLQYLDRAKRGNGYGDAD